MLSLKGNSSMRLLLVPSVGMKFSMSSNLTISEVITDILYPKRKYL